MKIKNMRSIFLFSLYFVLSLREVLGESEYDIKRGNYPYMAVVYYPDVTIVEHAGTRFIRSAVLIRSDWLISASLETNDTQLAFPHKTLMARAGAVIIDSNLTLNEDEGEQEREVILIIRSTNFTANEWWNNDMTLLKTLLPFTSTSTVGSTTLSPKQNNMDKNCHILVFAKKYQNSTDDKVLMQLAVELLPTSNENCGTHFRNETMICASKSDENKNMIYEPDFCYGNAGGPLICDGEVIGLQTYIHNNCKQPYLYQLLTAWDDFFTCGIEDKCRIQQCANICVSIDKDEEVTFGTNEMITMPTIETTKDITIEQSTEDSDEKDHSILSDTSPKVMVVNENETPTPTTTTTTSEMTTTKDTTPIAITESEEKTTNMMEESETSWPKEKFTEYRKNLDEVEQVENMERSSNVEAQHHEVKKKGRSAAESHFIDKMGLIHSLSFGILFFICII